MIRDIIKKIKTYDELENSYSILLQDHEKLDIKYRHLINEKKIVNFKLNNEIQDRILAEISYSNEKLSLLDKIKILEKRRRANAGAVGGLTAENNRLKRKIEKLQSNLDKATNIINDLNYENRRLKNPVTMKQLLDYERTRKPQREIKKKIQK